MGAYYPCSSIGQEVVRGSRGLFSAQVLHPVSHSQVPTEGIAPPIGAVEAGQGAGGGEPA